MTFFGSRGTPAEPAPWLEQVWQEAVLAVLLAVMLPDVAWSFARSDALPIAYRGDLDSGHVDSGAALQLQRGRGVSWV